MVLENKWAMEEQMQCQVDKEELRSLAVRMAEE